jgi:dihydroorotase
VEPSQLSEPSHLAFDLVLRNARLIDPAQGLDAALDVGIRAGRIAALGASIEITPGRAERDLRGAYVCPGLIDLHGHWYQASAWGIDPDLALARGSTTVVDAGTAGCINFADFRDHAVAASRARVLAFVNISAFGIPAPFAGELEDLRFVRPRETAAILEENARLAVGVKVRMKDGHAFSAFETALEVVRGARRPLMVHIGKGAATPRILRQLRAGDIVTHCFEGRGDGIVEGSRLLPEVLDARRDGVMFDVGHGCGSFSWDVARRAFEHSFYPDTISTDLHRYSIDRWAFDMPAIMTKFLHLGMRLEDVILKSTTVPARVLGRGGAFGTLRAGAAADLFAFALEEGEFRLEDTHLKIEIARRRIKPLFTMKDGAIIEPSGPEGRLRPLREFDHELLRSIEQSA